MIKMGDKKSINPAAAGLVGAAIGAAVGAAAVALSDEKNRKKLGKTVNEIKGKINEWRNDTEEKVENAKAQLEEAKQDKK